MDYDKLFEKWLKNELNEAEMKDFQQGEDYDLNQEIIDGAKHFKASHFSTVRSYDDFKKDINTSPEKPVIKFRPYKRLARIAAILVISLSAYFGFIHEYSYNVKTLASQQTTFILPDASEVILNASSEVIYKKKNWDTKRTLSLKGEAFFKVAKGSTFAVRTAKGTVSVLGTQFSVKQRGNYFEVKCFEGVVAVASEGENYKLTKGNTYRILQGKELLNTTDSQGPEWLNSITNFESVPLKEVLDELERQYAIKIIRNNIDESLIFTGGFIHGSLDEALASITVPLALDYSNETPNKIIIFKRK